MKNISLLHSILIFMIVNVNLSLCFEDNVSKKDKHADVTIRELICQLENKNGEPRMEGSRPRALWPAAYDFGEQARIKRVWTDLLRRAPDDLDEIVRHVGDKRYCLTVASPSGVDINLHVGDVCRYVLKKHVQPFQSPLSNQFSTLIPNTQDADKIQNWWKENNTRSLAELQLKAIDRARESKRKALDEADGPQIREEAIANLESLDEFERKIRDSREVFSEKDYWIREFNIYIGKKEKNIYNN